MILAKVDGKKILFTGDGIGNDILQNLSEIDLLNSENHLKVDILKVPHHGSERNVTKEFFKNIIADKYVISANGRDGNPDPTTLTWIVEAAKEDDRNIEIFLTNQTPSTKKLVEDYKPEEYGYQLKIMKKETHLETIELGD